MTNELECLFEVNSVKMGRNYIVKKQQHNTAVLILHTNAASWYLDLLKPDQLRSDIKTREHKVPSEEVKSLRNKGFVASRAELWKTWLSPISKLNSP